MAAVIFPVYVARGCGLDVHQQSVVASIAGKGIEAETKTFGIFTEELYQLVGWLQNSGITHIAMESTGVYWKPVYYILEDFFTILLVNARHIKNVPGHRTDKKRQRVDSQAAHGRAVKRQFRTTWADILDIQKKKP